MSFTIEDYHDLVQLLMEHPEWRSELRGLLLSDEILSLPEIVRELAEAQCRTEVRIEELAETQKNFEERLSRLEITVQKLVEQVTSLVEQVSKLNISHLQVVDTVGNMKGRLLELTYRDKAYGYFGHLLRHVKVANLSKIDDELEANLTPGEFHDVFRMDLMLSGQIRELPGRPEVFLVLEISSTVDENDVDRAWYRASLVRRIGRKVIPVVAGEKLSFELEPYAKKQNVVIMQDGQVLFWQEALSAWVNKELKDS
jgi:hypothetical protein